jgi:hypothetical protein
MKCPNCENSIENNAVTCEWCGINLQTFEAEQKVEAQRLAKEKEERELQKAKKQEEAQKKAKELEDNPSKAKEEINFIPQETQQQEILDKTSKKINNNTKRFNYKRIIIWSTVGLYALLILFSIINYNIVELDNEYTKQQNIYAKYANTENASYRIGNCGDLKNVDFDQELKEELSNKSISFDEFVDDCYYFFNMCNAYDNIWKFQKIILIPLIVIWSFVFMITIILLIKKRIVRTFGVCVMLLLFYLFGIFFENRGESTILILLVPSLIIAAGAITVLFYKYSISKK